MITRFAIAAIVAAAMLPTLASAQEAEKQYLFVQTATQASYADGALTLIGIGPTTAFFSDRPERDVGFVTQEEFLASWNGAEDAFASDPPNASVTFRQEGKPGIAIVELSEPVLTADGIRYKAEKLEGDLPTELGQVSLFIDSGGLMQLVAYGAQDVY